MSQKKKKNPQFFFFFFFFNGTEMTTRCHTYCSVMRKQEKKSFFFFFFFFLEGKQVKLTTCDQISYFILFIFFVVFFLLRSIHSQYNESLSGARYLVTKNYIFSFFKKVHCSSIDLLHGLQCWFPVISDRKN